MINVIIQCSNINETIQNRSYKKLKDTPAIEYLISRIVEIKQYKCFLITSDSAEDDVLEKIAEKYGISVFRGAFDDILGRMQMFTQSTKAECFVRVLGNYPLTDLSKIDSLVKTHIAGQYDYSYNEHIDGVLWGAGCEVFNSDLVERLIDENLDYQQQSTLSFYIRQHADSYRVQKACLPEKRKGYKVNLETDKDLEVIREIAANIDEITSETISDYLDKHPVLARYNLEAPAKEVGIDKILLHPEKISSILVGGDETGSYPISVELTLTNACNLKCVYCSDQELRERQGVGAHMDREVLFRLFDDLAAGGTKGITIEGGGEPSIYPYFNEVVTYAIDKGLAVGLITNGVKTLDKDIIGKFEWIRVSLDASTPEEYLSLKGVDCFETVISNIELYAQYCDTVGVGYVVTNQNLSQIEALVSRLREIGASYIQLRPVVDNDELYPKNINLNFLKLFMNKNFGVIVDGMEENAETGNQNLPCVSNNITSIISGDGSVYLCGRLNIYDWLEPIGNINTNRFSEIWNGDIHRRQKEMVLDPDFCSKNCPQCRVTKFNVLFDRVKKINSKHFI